MQKNALQKGQSLVTLLFFMVITIGIVSAAVVAIFVNSQSSSRMLTGEEAYYVAESGAENALIRLLREPNYAGETMEVGEGEAVISVSGTDTKTIVSTGEAGDHTRRVEVLAEYVDNILTVTSWKEIIL